MKFTFEHVSTFADAFAESAELYRTADEYGVAKTVFYDGKIGMPSQFANAVINEGWWLVRCMNGGECVGFWWLNGYVGRSAMIHFCFWLDDIDCAVDLARQSLEWLSKQDYTKSVYGLTPKPYRHVFPFIKRAGFDVYGAADAACYIKKFDRHVSGVLSILNLEGYRA